MSRNELSSEGRQSENRRPHENGRSFDIEQQDCTIGQLGEKAVLRRVLAQLSPAEAAVVGPGDDSAVLELRGQVVVTSDTMIEGSDFRLAWHSGFELGWKLAATNLSDIAAMGATPVGLTVALAGPRDTSITLLEEIARGLDAACRELAPGCGVIGGDLSSAPVLTAAITALGDMQGRPAVLRSGACVGDVVAYSGQLGLAGLGLSLLFRDCVDSNVQAQRSGVAALRSKHPAAVSAQLAPRPPIGISITAIEHGVSAMMDVSDGLSLDAARLAEASGVSIALDSGLLLTSFGLQEGQQVSLESMLTGGEDHGLLATFPEGAKLPAGFFSIGEVRAARPDEAALLLDGEPYAPRGWDPYAAPTVAE